jgi:hypothetical protein
LAKESITLVVSIESIAKEVPQRSARRAAWVREQHAE